MEKRGANVRLGANDHKLIDQVRKKMERLGVVNPSAANIVRFALKRAAESK